MRSRGLAPRAPLRSCVSRGSFVTGVGRPSYHRGYQTKVSRDRFRTRFCYDGNPDPHPPLIKDEEHPVIDRQCLLKIDDTINGDIRVDVVFLLDDLRDRVNEKNERAGVEPSALSEAVAIVHRCNSLPPMESPHPYKHGAPIRRFRKKPTPRTSGIVSSVRVFVSGDLLCFQTACSR